MVYFGLRHPPREDVSWNKCSRCSRIAERRHPPREDVSWNTCTIIRVMVRNGHPPREDVSWNVHHILVVKSSLHVILLVRMWVEIRKERQVLLTFQSSSSWGCELKYSQKKNWRRLRSHPPREDVSWNDGKTAGEVYEALSSSSWGCELKLFTKKSSAGWRASSSSWGCELKWIKIILSIVIRRHPPREDVSWNLKTMILIFHL